MKPNSLPQRTLWPSKPPPLLGIIYCCYTRRHSGTLSELGLGSASGSPAGVRGRPPTGDKGDIAGHDGAGGGVGLFFLAALSSQGAATGSACDRHIAQGRFGGRARVHLPRFFTRIEVVVVCVVVLLEPVVFLR